MSQRLQSIFFFLSALLFALLFFMPLAEYFGELNILRFNVYGVESTMPDGVSPFKTAFSLPVLILTVTAMLLSGYLAMSLFRAVKLAQFVKLHLHQVFENFIPQTVEPRTSIKAVDGKTGGKSWGKFRH